jgi:copper chaperone CopZ
MFGMKYPLPVAFITFLLLAGLCSGVMAGEAAAPETGETRIYEVYGMDCPGCHGGVEKLVRKLPQVKTTKANWKKKQLVVEMVPGASLDDELVHDAIERANFTPGKRIQ